MKSILILAKSLGGGGSEVALVNLLNNIDYNNYKVKLVLLDKDNEFMPKIRMIDKLEIDYINFKNKRVKNFVSMYSFIGKFFKKIKINKYIKFYEYALNNITNNYEEKYDIAIDFYGYGYLLTAFLSEKIIAKKKATWVHDEKINWILNVERYLYNIDKVICVSNSVKRKIDSILNINSEVIYNYVDINKVLIESSKFYPKEFKKDVFNILTVGRLHKQKGLDIALDIAKKLKNKNINFKWYFIGEGKEEKNLKKKVIFNNLSDYVVFLGKKDNPYPYIKNCDLYVQPSRHEGYGLALLEARLLKKIIVATKINPFEEQIIDKFNGYLCDLKILDFSDRIISIYNKSEDVYVILENIEREKISFEDEIKKIYNL